MAMDSLQNIVCTSYGGGQKSLARTRVVQLQDGRVHSRVKTAFPWRVLRKDSQRISIAARFSFKIVQKRCGMKKKVPGTGMRTCSRLLVAKNSTYLDL